MTFVCLDLMLPACLSSCLAGLLAFWWSFFLYCLLNGGKLKWGKMVLSLRENKKSSRDIYFFGKALQLFSWFGLPPVWCGSRTKSSTAAWCAVSMTEHSFYIQTFDNFVSDCCSCVCVFNSEMIFVDFSDHNSCLSADRFHRYSWLTVDHVQLKSCKACRQRNFSD